MTTRTCRRLGLIAVTAACVAAMSDELSAQVRKQSAATKIATDYKRPVRPVLDLNDTEACLRELAELASFATYSEARGTYRANAVGLDGLLLPPDPVEQMDRLVRFDRLSQCADPELRRLSAEVKQISVDVWRFNLALHRFGTTAMKNTLVGGALRGAINDIAASAVSESNADAARRDATTIVRGREVVDEQKYRSLLESSSGNVAALRQRADEARESARETHREQIALTLVTNELRSDRQQELARLWKEHLLPRLRKHAPPDKVLVEAWKETQNLSKAAVIRNISGMALHRVVIALNYRGNFGEERFVYAYLPEVPPKDTINVMFGQQPVDELPTTLLDFSEQVDAAFFVTCQEGSQSEQGIDLPTAYFHVLGEAHEIPRKERRDLYYSTVRKYQGLKEETLRLLRAQFPTPTNPDLAGDRLFELARGGLSYQVEYGVPGRQRYYVKLMIKLEPFGDRTGVISGNIKMTTRDDIEEKATTLDIPVVGRLVEELERGCVIALFSTLTPLSSSRDHLLEEGKKRPLNPFERRMLKDATIRASKAEAAWKSQFKHGGFPVITSPYDVLHPPKLSAFGVSLTPEAKRQAREYSQRRDASKIPNWVIYLPSGGDGPMLQTPPGDNDEIAHVSLQPSK